MPKPDFVGRYAQSDEYRDESGQYMVYGHGYFDAIWNGKNNQWINSPSQLADLLKKYGWKPGNPVVLYACRTGDSSPHHPSLAEKFAKQYNTPVLAPNKQLWYNENSGGTGPSLIFGKNSDGSMNSQDPGGMQNFGPPHDFDTQPKHWWQR